MRCKLPHACKLHRVNPRSSWPWVDATLASTSCGSCAETPASRHGQLGAVGRCDDELDADVADGARHLRRTAWWGASILLRNFKSCIDTCKGTKKAAEWRIFVCLHCCCSHFKSVSVTLYVNWLAAGVSHARLQLANWAKNRVLGNQGGCRHS